MSKETVLVTGGAGFIGSFVVDELIKEGYKVKVFDNLEPQVHSKDGKLPDYLNKEAEFILGDVRDYDAFKKVILDVDVIFHKAAAVGVTQSMYEINRYVDVNATGTANLFDIIVNNKNKVRKVIIAASMSSYGEGKYECEKCGIVRPPLRSKEQMEKKEWELTCPNCKKILKPIAISEDDYQFPNSTYAITKKIQEEIALNIGTTYNIPVVSLRYFNVYGLRQSLSNPYNGVIAGFISRIKNGNPPIIFEDGLQTRDFISVKDVAKLNIEVMNNKKADYQIFNVGCGIPVSIKEITEKLIKIFDSKLTLEVKYTFRKGDTRHCFADITKLKKILGFEPIIKFDDGLKEVVKWSLSQDAKDLFSDAISKFKEKGLA